MDTSPQKMDRKRGSQEATEGTPSKKRKEARESSLEPEAEAQTRTVFERKISEFGYELKDKGFHVINSDQATFLKKLCEELETSDDTEIFVKEAMEYFQSGDSVLEKSLKPSETSSSCQDARGQYQDSLIYLLLSLEPVQKPLFTWLLEKMAEISLEEEDSLSEKNQSLIRLILNHLKYLNIFRNGAELSDKYLEILDVVPPKVQLEMIASLPEVIDYENHDKVGQALKEMLTRCSSLSAVILDAMTNLNLNEGVIEDIRSSIAKTVSSTEVDNLPIVVKFILYTTISVSDCYEMISTLREQLDLSPPPVTLTQGKSPFSELQVLTLEAFRSSIMRSKAMGDSWLKAIDAVSSTKEHQSLDIIIIIILMDIPNRQKAAANLFKNKIRSGLFNEELLIKTITNFGSTIKKNLQRVLDLVDPMISADDPALNHAAETIYVQIFVTMDKFCKQEIILELTTKVSSNTKARQGALNMLSNLAYNHTDILAGYAIFLSGIMDYMDSMSLDQVRRIMDILSLLAYNNPGEQNVIRDDVHIVVTKQLSSVNPKIKRMGVIGAVVTIKNMSRFQSDLNASELDKSLSELPSTSEGEAKSALPTSALRQAKELLVNVRVMTSKVGEFAGLFMDELSNVIKTGKVDKRLEKWIADTMVNDFQESFISDVTPDCKPDDDFIPHALQWDLDSGQDPESSADDVSFALNLSPMVVKSYNVRGEVSKLEATKAARFIPHFRLLKTCVFVRNKGDLSEIDGLLGCPSWFVDFNIIEKIETLSLIERSVICSSLFYAINWYREVINSFAPAEDMDYRAKVVTDLKIITQLRKKLIFCLRYNPEFVPPSVLHSIDVSKWKPPTSSIPQIKKSVAKKGTKRKVSSETQGSQVSQLPASVGLTQSQSASSFSPQGSVVTDLESQYGPFFRELDLDAFHILSYDTITIDISEEEDGNNFDLKDNKLRGPELLYLLKDIFNKFDHSLISKAAPQKVFPGKGNSELKSAGFSNLDALPRKEVATFGVTIIEYVVANLEIISEYYSRLLKMNDGIEDDHSLYDKNTCVSMQCLEYGFRILDKLFSWNGFASSSMRHLLKEGLAKLACRAHVEMNKNTPLKELVEATVDYIFKFGENLFCSVGVAAAIVKCLDTLKFVDINSEDDSHISGRIIQISEFFLKKEWKDSSGKLEKGSLFNKHVEFILTKFLSNQDSTGLLETYVDEITTVVSNGQSDKFLTFTKATFNFHFRALFISLICYAQTITYGARKDHEGQLEDWSALILLLYKMTMTVKVKCVPVLISIVAKQSRIFLDHFIKNGMPMIDKIFKTKRQDVVHTLKSLQRVTRFLQHVCSHSKLNNDISLSNHVPLLKRTLETFVYRVKVTLAYNDCLNAFLMGNLKNRDLDGAEIPNEESEEEENDDEYVEEEEDKNDADESSEKAGSGDENIDDDDDIDTSNNDNIRHSMSIEI